MSIWLRSFVVLSFVVGQQLPNYSTAQLQNQETTETFYYSYYYPDLLAPGEIENGVCANQEGGICHTVNCFDYDLLAGRCRSPMATGLDWHQFLGRSVACGYEYPIGTVFHVITPAKLAGDHPCLDRCPACTGKKLLDFLSPFQQLPWQTPLRVEVRRGNLDDG